MTEQIILPAFPQVDGYHWRHAEPSDAAAICRLKADIEKVDRRSWIDTLDDIQRDFEDQDSDYSTDTLLALTPDGQLAALGWVYTPEAGQDDYIAFLAGEVHPDHRGRGLGTAVLEWMQARGAQTLARHPQDGKPRYFRMHCHDHLTDRQALIEQQGFRPARHFYNMERDLRQPISNIELPAGVQLEGWDPLLSDDVRNALNEAFSDHWGNIIVTNETWQLWFLDHPNFRPELTRLATVAENGVRKVAGLCFNEVHQAENAASGKNQAWIRALAVRRDYRRQGPGSALLCDSMQAFRQAGYTSAGLGVDSENTTGALRIYQRLGFEVIQRATSYLKPCPSVND